MGAVVKQPTSRMTGFVDSLLLTGMASLARCDPSILEMAERELSRQANQLNLVAAASPTLPAVLITQALGFSSLTAEGYPGRRYHPGTDVVDEVEQLAVERAELLFGAENANVQPLSGTAANLAMLYGLLGPPDSVLSMDLSHGGHLSHVARLTSASKRIKATYYRLGADGVLDIEEIRTQAMAAHPALIICGGSAYPRRIDFQSIRSIADEVGALLVGDISHISGLIAAGIHPSPFPHCDVVTTSTYKQLCGPHGGIVFRGRGSRVSSDTIDRLIFPSFQGTPDFGMIAAKAVALGAALQPAFTTAMQRVVHFAGLFAKAFAERGLRLVAGGTDTHMILVDLRGVGVTGKTVSDALKRAGILANKNLIPDDPRSAVETSGLRLGTNHLAFMEVDDQDVTELASNMAELVIGLGGGMPPERCPAWRDLTEHVSVIMAAGYRRACLATAAE